ncbi:DUF1801 domain-containing protein [Archangium sp.]|uniref:DUF1801 domain-containing protein n=1 Tax=Archangium sp. TaxID=1872627 RepID=UPI00286C3A85|nr:DUF1801 domain-containing protein [Archangium sp.]
MPTRRRSSSKQSEGRASCSPDDILHGHTPEVRAIAERARALIKRELPEVEENGYPGWRLIGYRQGGAYLGFVAPLKDHVRLGFERGVYMNDPDGLLEGDGTQVRYVRLSSEDLPEAGLVRLLSEAVSLSKLSLGMLPAKKVPASRRR